MTRRRARYLVPVGGVVERETHRVAAPAQDVEGRARVPQRLKLLARGAEGHDHIGAVDGVVDPEDVREGPACAPATGCLPRHAPRRRPGGRGTVGAGAARR